MRRVEIHLTDKSQAMLKYFQFSIWTCPMCHRGGNQSVEAHLAMAVMKPFGFCPFPLPNYDFDLTHLYTWAVWESQVYGKKKKRSIFWVRGKILKILVIEPTGDCTPPHMTHTQHTRLLSISSNPISRIATYSLSLDLLFIFFMNWLIVWSPRWQKIAKNTLHSFLK